MFLYTTNSPEETVDFGKKLGKLIEPGMVILLIGDLGAGKTCLAGGILKALGVEDYVTSPTYTLVNEYWGSLPVAHFDLYRLDEPDQLFDIGFEEYLDGERVVLIEWPERANGYLPPTHLKVELTGEGERRNISLVPVGAKYRDLCERMKDFVGAGD
ncbi:tRNA (N6-adenosine(37)-N6)-threonylcarbamoyltransferase complex ATPase TsaE [Anoxybacter fermentans]|uniref:tRNA threonylcarbamoyladenosine biosynthesis protein TsaE n=1 Tax=Anoxybacter fermentans TaxID=1323375 RepID=A0A3Q9HNE5_9FIRM|nr:tRNA (adenosine(37)-N6)-threonylcarbamoyltransferase complex ATPase subunit type 1 TsaE [Anoxybacter fermentans]AZR71988.1 tRNA (N6-adenosine(37)-N6)-threonylcarbamoyltransferase complex ATPase TsaE [Anoxybacter fermentans]